MHEVNQLNDILEATELTGVGVVAEYPPLPVYGVEYYALAGKVYNRHEWDIFRCEETDKHILINLCTGEICYDHTT